MQKQKADIYFIWKVMHKTITDWWKNPCKMLSFPSYFVTVEKPLCYVSFNFECAIWKSNPIGYLSTPAASVAYFKSMQSKPSFFGSQLSNESVKGSENFPPSIFCRQRPRSLLFWFGYCATISTMGSKPFWNISRVSKGETIQVSFNFIVHHCIVR